MANSRAVWGIDIGQSALKAMRCSEGEDGSIVASSYDYIEYPKILSQPDADADELVNEALQTFLGRNELEGDFVSMSVSGQAGLSRFFRPPPVDLKTLPDIVKYEVKQQIPFPIEDVIWDWQCLGGTESDDLIIDAEVGLFAIKRDTVFQALQPFDEAGIEVDLVQLSPLSVFNVICHEVLGEIPEVEQIDPENPPESLVVLSLGTDSTDLIITNGIKLWLRNIPIGGNHFTKQLSRELKLTHAKAEHLKRNVRQMAENEEEARRVFQSMRPVFNDMVTEIQRSLTFYGGIEKNAKIERVVLLGNAARLPGLRQYLTKQLELDIVKLNSFPNLQGDAVIKEKSFSDNLLSFTPCYGLCLQGLNEALIETNLLPQEIVKERLIRAKKPWVLAAVAALLAGMTFGYLFSNLAWWRVDDRYASGGGASWGEAFTEITRKVENSNDLIDKDDDQKRNLERLNFVSVELADPRESPAALAELLSSIYQILPKDEEAGEERVLDPIERPFDERNEIYVDSMETKMFYDLSSWRDESSQRFDAQFEQFLSVQDIIAGVKQEQLEFPEHDMKTSGWVVELKAHHYHNNKQQRLSMQNEMEFVRRILLDKMFSETVMLPGTKQKDDGTFELEKFKLEDLGVFYPTVVWEGSIRETTIANVYAGKDRGPEDTKSDEATDDKANETKEGPNSESPADKAKREKMDRDTKEFKVNRFDFVLQFAWVPTDREGRIDSRDARVAEETKNKDDAEQKKKKKSPNK